MSDVHPAQTSSRTLAGWDYFLLWTGAAIALPEIWAGGLLTTQGLVLGLLAILLGHLIGTLALSGAGLIGSRHGVPAIVSTRGALGHGGSYIAGFLNVIQLLGWTGFMIWVATQAALALPNIPAMGKTGWTLAIGALTTLWALAGNRHWRKLQYVGVLLLFVLSIVLTWRVLTAYSLHDLLRSHIKATSPFLLALDAVIVMPISWLPLVADYARYARADKPCFVGTFCGYFFGSCWMYAVGLVTALATQSDTPDSIVIKLMADTGWAGSALVIVLLSTCTTTFLDIFSTAVSTQSVLPKLPERPTILVVGAVGTALALWFDANSYAPFLTFIGAAFCPLFGIVLSDYFFLKRGRFEPQQGVKIPALVAWVLGFALYHVITHFGWPVGASIPSMIVAAGLHLLFSGRSSRD